MQSWPWPLVWPWPWAVARERRLRRRPPQRSDASRGVLRGIPQPCRPWGTVQQGCEHRIWGRASTLCRRCCRAGRVGPSCLADGCGASRGRLGLRAGPPPRRPAGGCALLHAFAGPGDATPAPWRTAGGSVVEGEVEDGGVGVSAAAPNTKGRDGIATGGLPRGRAAAQVPGHKNLERGLGRTYEGT